MNPLAQSIQDDDLRFSPGLFLSGLKRHKLNGIQIDRKECIVDRSRQLSDVSRFVPQEFIERLLGSQAIAQRASCCLHRTFEHHPTAAYPYFPVPKIAALPLVHPPKLPMYSPSRAAA